MIHLTFRTPALLITMPILALIASSSANAEIYKWRDSRGITQYSDRAPVDNATKLTPNELVNSLQTKDLCTVGPIKKSVSKNVASTEEQNGFFNIFSQARAKAAVVAASSPIRYAVAQPVIRTPVTMITVPQAVKPTIPANTSPPVTTAPTTQIKNPPPATNPPVSNVTTSPATPQMPPTQTAVNTPPASTPAVNNPVNNVSNIVQKLLMPAVDISKNIIPVIGYNSLRIRQTTEVAPSGGGAFRIPCGVSHMSNDDPLVYPNQQGATHHHTFFGNTSVNYKSNLETLSTTGNSTCNGGTMNRSGYWVTTMIDTETNTPVIPTGNILVYYKKSYWADAKSIKAPPKGLRMIAGDSKATDGKVWNHAGFKCHPGPKSKRKDWPHTQSITPASGCETGDSLDFTVAFPSCWDGKNLDSPNHKDHMAYETSKGCPATHPVTIPEIMFNVNYIIKATDKINNWRLASDNYSKNLPGGYSAHGDWVNGWDQKTIEGIVKNCLNTPRDGHAHLMCDGRQFY